MRAQAPWSILVGSGLWQPQRGVRQRECTADSRVPVRPDQGDRRVDDPQQRRQPTCRGRLCGISTSRGRESGTRRHQRVQPDPHGLPCLAEDRRPQVFGDDYPIRRLLHPRLSTWPTSRMPMPAAAACERPGSARPTTSVGAGGPSSKSRPSSARSSFRRQCRGGARRLAIRAVGGARKRSTTTWDVGQIRPARDGDQRLGGLESARAESVNRPRVVTSS